MLCFVELFLFVRAESQQYEFSTYFVIIFLMIMRVQSKCDTKTAISLFLWDRNICARDVYFKIFTIKYAKENMVSYYLWNNIKQLLFATNTTPYSRTMACNINVTRVALKKASMVMLRLLLHSIRCECDTPKNLFVG